MLEPHIYFIKPAWEDKMKNKKGQMVMFGLMMMLFIIATTMVLIQPMREIVNDYRTDRDCGNWKSVV